jgi:23S rRNA pseudouridine1911/1915/1917 synthase
VSDSDDIDVPAALAGVRVDRAVALLADVTRAEAARLVDDGGVRVGRQVVRDRSRRLREHDRLSIDPAVLSEVSLSEVLPAPTSEVPFTVVHEDDSIIVVDKPAGVVVHPGAGNQAGTLAAGLVARYPELAELPAGGAGEPGRPGIVHRLDKETSGLLVVARTPPAYHSLVAQLSTRAMGRTYLAIVLGHPEARSGVVDAPIGRAATDPTLMAVSAGGREARTRYRVIERHSEPVEASLLELSLETGRTHQIRVHMAAIGHPVLGDRRYGGRRGAMEVPRPMLHAWKLSLDHPATGVRAVYETDEPPDFAEVLDRLS